MSYINESCGCDSGSSSNYDVINNSPILSGSQETTFSPMNDNFSFLDSLNDQPNSTSILGKNENNFSNNDETKQNYSLDDLISMSKENNTSDENKFSNNNIQEMNNNQFNNYPTQQTNDMLTNNRNNAMNNPMNNSPMNNSPMNNPMNNSAMNNPMNMPDPGMMRNMPTNVNPELQMVMNKIAQANNNKNIKEEIVEEKESAWRFILKNFNIVLIVIIGLAWSDVAKFYINRSIKFGGGNHRYYVYYAVIATVVLYGTSKYINSL
jgi:hypothetical protein